jgi:hypothetical protein
MQNIVQNLVVVFIFASCAALIALVNQPETGNAIVQLLILAGIVVAFMDGHNRTRQTNERIRENTEITAKTEQLLNGKTQELIRTTSQAAYAKGLLDGQQQERERQSTTNRTNTPNGTTATTIGSQGDSTRSTSPT